MSDAVLRAINVSKYFGGIQANKDVSFDLMEGEILGMIGPNGAGKTTMFNILAGVYPATSGDVEFFGHNINKVPTHKRVEMGMARTFQNIKLFQNVSVLENVMAGRHCRTKSWFIPILFNTKGVKEDNKNSEELSRKMIDFVGLTEKIDEYARNLPYGEQRDLEIARALATEPKVILLDEPCAGMNEGEKDNLQKLVRRIRGELGITVLIIEHDMKVIMSLCDRIVVLNQGEEIALGTPEEVRNNPAVIEAYLGSSAGRRDRFVKN